jgi:hypothetical protein
MSLGHCLLAINIEKTVRESPRSGRVVGYKDMCGCQTVRINYFRAVL